MGIFMWVDVERKSWLEIGDVFQVKDEELLLQGPVPTGQHLRLVPKWSGDGLQSSHAGSHNSICGSQVIIVLK